MIKKTIIISILYSSALSGCVLDPLPPECPPGQHEDENGDGSCVSNSKTSVACGYPEVDCTQQPGVRFASCEDGFCHASECNVGYHLVTNELTELSECIEDTVANCGADKNDCHDVRGVKNVKCEMGICVAIDCKSDFEKQNDVCISKKVSSCGSPQTNCLEAYSHYNSIDCLNGQCKVQSCEIGFHLANNQCVLDSIQACGEKLTDCQKEMGESASVYTCHRGKCEAKACKPGFALYDTICQKDDQRECDKQSDCDYPPMTYAEKTECIEGVCKIVTCKKGYELKGSFCSEVPYKDNCQTNQECESQKKDTIEKVICYENQCINLKCIDGYHFNASYDCEMDTSEACGNGANNQPVNCLDRIDKNHINAVECKDGKCQITKCDNGFTINNGESCDPS